VNDRHAVDVGEDAAGLRPVEEGSEGDDRIAEDAPGAHGPWLDQLGADKPRWPRVRREMLERLLAVSHECDVRGQRTQLSLQGSHPLIHSGAQDDGHRSAH